MDPEALFVYGSLQFPDVLVALIDRIPDHEPVAAEGWRVAALPERVYPGLVPGEGIARGFLLTGLTAEEWRVLDAFEDPVYDLTRIALVDGRHGWGYVCNAGAKVEAHDWSVEDFQARHLTTYVERCATWRRRYEQQEQAG
ncbi:gamma-glutamylcyclotransferase [Actinoallomurus spadix]|uniref:Putative gamma-glutamylcyclotransferase n=1 Tax=Actinoallomurus spadix TaxID=79912 RepID=A0ABN0WXF2_9ACTN|nr:gamma-glutamylcyclotransferase family protein [Actinoallomurus spadix]MCO5991609.1 gamma-glutamylcyclotransferase [Actinoallomurus spadix]